MRRPTIGVSIITRNEENWIAGCLSSLSWVNQIVVVDAESSDRTVEIAKKFTKHVYQNKWDGFTNQKNRTLKYLTTDWVLALDADERSTPDFKKAILNAVQDNQYAAYRMPTRNILLGREMKHGGWYPDCHVRLFRRKNFKGWTGAIHERAMVEGPIGDIKEGFVHLSHRDIASMLEKTIRYSAVEAAWRNDAKFPKVTLTTLLKVMAKEFYFRAIKERGFLDGIEGWIEIVYQVFSKFITYARLWELQQPTPLRKTYQKIDREIAQLNEKDK